MKGGGRGIHPHSNNIIIVSHITVCFLSQVACADIEAYETSSYNSTVLQYLVLLRVV